MSVTTSSIPTVSRPSSSSSISPIATPGPRQPDVPVTTDNVDRQSFDAGQTPGDDMSNIGSGAVSGN